MLTVTINIILLLFILGLVSLFVDFKHKKDYKVSLITVILLLIALIVEALC